ncbi:MAG: DUF4114 domain-containing protein [Desulfobacteraceae bacterium]|nr:MAG: DUF4114 domain-containing protein [Desulfobacteraceae bacterium]
MKKVSVALVVTIAALFLHCGSARAYLTTINPIGGSGSEPSLFNIMDTLYGVGNYNRVDDSFDQVWLNISGSATAMAKYASYSQTFGYIPETDPQFHELFKVTGSGYLSGFSSSNAKKDKTLTGLFEPGSYSFLFANDPNGAGEPPMWTSQQSSNSPGFYDHMVTFSLAGGNYVIAWEDLNLGDYDYNDLVVEVGGVSVSAVPEPATILLIGSGILGFLGLRRAGARSSKTSAIY